MAYNMITIRKHNWTNYKIEMRDVACLYEKPIFDTFDTFKPIVCWYIDMGLFETLEIILGEELDLHFVD